MYIYESHMGGIYTSEKLLPIRKCSQCGDYDWLCGDFNSAIKFLIFYADEIDCYDGNGGTLIDYILPELSVFEDCPSMEEAIKIVQNNRMSRMSELE